MNYFETYSHTSKDYVTAIAATVQGTSGIAVAPMIPVSVGYIWRLERYSVWSSSAGNPVFELFVGSNGEQFTTSFNLDRTRRVDFTLLGKNNVSDNVSPPIFDEGEVPIFAWSGCTNGDVCQATIQIRWYQKTPVLGHRAATALKEHLAVEQWEQAGSEIAGGWNTDAQGRVLAGSVYPTGPADSLDGVIESGLGPWTSHDPMDVSVDPASLYMPPGTGQVAGAGQQSEGHSQIPGDDG